MLEESELELDDELRSDVKRPHPRWGHTAVLMNGSIVVFGGACSVTDSEIVKYYSMRVIWSFNLDIERWIKCTLPETQMIPKPRIGQCFVVVGSAIYIHGGCKFKEDGFKGKTFSGLWKLSSSDEGIAWTEIQFHTGQLIPTARTFNTGWEHQNKLWIFGGKAKYNNNPFYAIEDFQVVEGCIRGYTKQFFCFNPAKNIWTTVKCFGSVPSPRCLHAITKIQKTIWLHGGKDYHRTFDDLYELNLHSLIWTQIQSNGSLRPKDYGHSLVAISDKQIVLYGSESARWILDLPSLSWKQCLLPVCVNGVSSQEKRRWQHTGTIGINNVIIFGGMSLPSKMTVNNILCIVFEPKTLLKCCLETVFSHRSLLKGKWHFLPRNLNAQLRAMCELGTTSDEDSSVGDVAANAGP